MWHDLLNCDPDLSHALPVQTKEFECSQVSSVTARFSSDHLIYSTRRAHSLKETLTLHS